MNLTQRHRDTEKTGEKHFLFTSVSLCLCVMLLGAACGRKIKESNLSAIKPEMTTKEVESILGAPNRIESVSEQPTEAIKTLSVTRFVYEQNGKKIELTFVGDRLVEGPAKGAPAIKGKLGK